MFGPEYRQLEIVLFSVAPPVLFLVVFLVVANRHGRRNVVVDATGIQAQTLSGRVVRIPFGEIGEAFIGKYSSNGNQHAQTTVRSRDGKQKIVFTIHDRRWGELLRQLRDAGVAVDDRVTSEETKSKRTSVRRAARLARKARAGGTGGSGGAAAVLVALLLGGLPPGVADVPAGAAHVPMQLELR